MPRYPAEYPEWIPTVQGLQETREPFRFVSADKLTSYSLGTGWAQIHRIKNRAAFRDAWLMWLCRRLREARISAAATREVDTLRTTVGAGLKTKRTAKTVKNRPGIRARKRTQRS